MLMENNKKKRSADKSFLIKFDNDRWNYAQILTGDKGDVVKNMTYNEFLSQINDSIPSFNRNKRLLIIFIFICIFLLSINAPIWLLNLMLLIFVPLYIYIYYADKKIIYLDYELNSETSNLYSQINNSFKTLHSCSSIWEIKKIEDTHEWKYNGGASQSVDKKKIVIWKKTPSFIKSNLIPYSFKANNQFFYFFPDNIINYKSKKLISISYSDITLAVDYSSFIENWRAPSDSTVIGFTWLHVNRDGSPDKRFKDNRKMPRVLYSDVYIKTPEITIILQCSKKEAGKQFIKDLSPIIKHQQKVNKRF